MNRSHPRKWVVRHVTLFIREGIDYEENVRNSWQKRHMTFRFCYHDVDEENVIPKRCR